MTLKRILLKMIEAAKDEIAEFKPEKSTQDENFDEGI